MAVGIGATGQASSTTGAQSRAEAQSTPPGGQLGENAFLQLLVAQLKYQDPMQPVDNTQFVTQLAQFQMLSVLSDIKADMDKLVAAVGPTSESGRGSAASGNAAASDSAGTAATGSAGG